MGLEKISEMRKSSGLSLDELSERSGVPKGTLSKISAGITKNPSIDTIKAIVHSMGFTLDDLDDAPIKKNSKCDEEFLKKYCSLDHYGKEAVDNLLEIEYRRVQENKIAPIPEEKIIYLPEPIQSASAGTGQLADDETCDQIPVIYNSLTSKADYIMRICGDSMEPKIHDGDNLLIRRQPAVNLGEIGIFVNAEERYVKIYRGDHLESINPMYNNISTENMKCVGKVIGRLDPEWIK